MTQLHDLVCVRGKETFGLSLWAKDTKEALHGARLMLRDTRYAVHPAPKGQPEQASYTLPLAA